MSPDDWPFSPDEIAETRRIISQTLKARSIRMGEEQIDVAMRRLLLQAQASADRRGPGDGAHLRGSRPTGGPGTGEPLGMRWTSTAVQGLGWQERGRPASALLVSAPRERKSASPAAPSMVGNS